MSYHKVGDLKVEESGTVLKILAMVLTKRVELPDSWVKTTSKSTTAIHVGIKMQMDAMDV